MESVKIRTQLEMCLAKIRRPGEFCCAGVFPGHFPGIIVNNFGMLGLPLPTDKANQLARVCSSGHCDSGKDTSKNNPQCGTWHLDPTQFKICNPEWHSEVDKFVYSNIRSELGIPTVGSVTVELNCLCLYKKGSCRLPQLNAATDKHTFATVVLLLPSVYAGGQLTVTHTEKTETFDYSSEASFRNHYVAFYANCSQQMQPVTSGNLLALVYNLVHVNSACLMPSPSDTYDIIPNVAQILKRWQYICTEGAINHKSLFLVLNLSCNNTGLSWKRLKGRDRMVASIVRSAVDKSSIEVFLCLLHFTRRFKCDAAEFPCDSSEESKYDDAYSSLSSDSKKSVTRSLEDDIELESNCHVSHFIKENGTRSNTVNVQPMLSQIIPSNIFVGLRPYEEDEMANGDMGTTKLKCYRQAALLLVPRKDFNQIMSEGSLSEVIDLALDCAENLSKDKLGEMQHKCTTVVNIAITRIENMIGSECQMSVAVLHSHDCIKLLRTLQLMNNIALFRWFISKVVMLLVNGFSMNVFLHLARLIPQFGLDDLLPVFQSLVNSAQTSVIMDLLKELCVTNLDVIKIPDELTHLLAAKLLERLVDVKDKNLEEAPKFRSLKDLYRDTIVAVTGLFCTYSTFGNEDWLQQAIHYVRRTPLRHPVEIVVTSAIENWHGWLMEQTKKSISNGFKYAFAIKQKQCLLEDCIKQLMFVRKPTESTDSGRSLITSCICSDCKTVEDFLNDAEQNVLSMLVTQASLDHLQRYQKLSVLELRCKKVDSSSFPGDAIQTLTLSKKNASDRLRETYNRCQAAVNSLISLLPQNHHLKRPPNENADEAPFRKKAKYFTSGSI